MIQKNRLPLVYTSFITKTKSLRKMVGDGHSVWKKALCDPYAIQLDPYPPVLRAEPPGHPASQPSKKDTTEAVQNDDDKAFDERCSATSSRPCS